MKREKLIIIAILIAFISLLYFLLNRSNNEDVLSSNVQNEKLNTYVNYRFGYEIDYPLAWKPGMPSDNGDGVVLYTDPEGNEVVVYGTHVPSPFSTQDAPVERQLYELENGITATSLKIVDEEDMVRYIVFFAENEIQYVFYSRSTEDFYDKNKPTFDSVAKSFRTTKPQDSSQ